MYFPGKAVDRCLWLITVSDFTNHGRSMLLGYDRLKTKHCGFWGSIFVSKDIVVEETLNRCSPHCLETKQKLTLFCLVCVSDPLAERHGKVAVFEVGFVSQPVPCHRT